MKAQPQCLPDEPHVTQIPHRGYWKLIYGSECVNVSIFFSSPTMALFGKRSNTKLVCSLSVRASDALPHQRLGMDGTQSSGACTVPFTLHPHSHCSSSPPVRPESLQGRQSEASPWLLWLCRSQQGCHIRSTGSTPCNTQNLIIIYASETQYVQSLLLMARNKTNCCVWSFKSLHKILQLCWIMTNMEI